MKSCLPFSSLLLSTMYIFNFNYIFVLEREKEKKEELRSLSCLTLPPLPKMNPKMDGDRRTEKTCDVI